MPQAHKCPVCNGRGKVPPNFYDLELSVTTDASEQVCRSCDGWGYIWDEVVYVRSPRIKKLKARIEKALMIMRELDDGYRRITDENDPDKYPPFALTAWEDRNRYRSYVERVLMRLEEEGKL